MNQYQERIEQPENMSFTKWQTFHFQMKFTKKRMKNKIKQNKNKTRKMHTVSMHIRARSAPARQAIQNYLVVERYLSRCVRLLAILSSYCVCISYFTITKQCIFQRSVLIIVVHTLNYTSVDKRINEWESVIEHERWRKREKESSDGETLYKPSS